MTTLSLQTPLIGQLDSTEEPKIASDLVAISAWANGNIDAGNLANGAVTPAKLSAGAAANGTLLTSTQFSYGAGGGANGAYTLLAAPLSFTMPAAGVAVVTGNVLLGENGATGTLTGIAIYLALSVDAGTLVSDGARSYIVTSAVDYYLEAPTWKTAALTAGAHALQVFLVVPNNPVSFAVVSAGGLRVHYQTS